MNIKTDIILRTYLKYQAGRLRCGDIVVQLKERGSASASGGD
jgi:hypothetical protein